MNKCLRCSKETTNLKYCSHSCRAKDVNSKRKSFSNKICKICGKEFYISNNSSLYCSKECFLKRKTMKNIIVKCLYCKKTITSKHINKNTKYCSGICRNKSLKLIRNTRKSGYSRSKLEKYLEQKLKQKFPTLQFLFNDDNVIGSELDIYIPNFKLAFEINGIFHYIPVYGNKVFKKIQANDQQKIISCIQNNIEFVSIDTSSMKYFKESKAINFFVIIKDIIEQKIGATGGN
jgi:hypothetical protein